MKKLFTIAAALMVSFSLWADSVTFSATEMSEQASGVTKGDVTALCPTKVGDQQWYKNSSTIKAPAISLGSSADTAVIVPASGKSLHFRVADGFVITGISIEAAANKDSVCGEPIVIWAGEINKTPAYVGNIDVPARNETEKPAAVEVGNIPTGATAFAVYRRIKYNSTTGEIGSGSNFGRSQQTWNIFNVTVTYEAVTPSTDPVTAAAISGENACMIGSTVTLTCTAAKATTYQWYLNGAAIDGATAKTYAFTPTAAGEFSFTCAASNDYTTTPVVSAAHVVEVVDPSNVCGELIKATHTGEKTATVTGILGGTVDKQTQGGGKLGSNGHYFGIKLANGSFMPGDLVTVEASKLEGGNAIDVFSDKGTTRLVAESLPIDTIAPAVFTLSATTEWIYIYRLSSATNPSIKSISVTRSCEASNNADMGSLTINGETIQAVNNVYSYTVGASVDLTQVAVAFTLAHPLASANVTSPFMIDVPAAGADANTQVITVTAQDGTTTANYTVSVSKSAAANNDATLSALAVNGYTLSPAFAADVTTYTITKGYQTENPAVDAVSATANDANAQTPVIALNGDAFTVTVTAEDGTTQLVYTINIVEAAAKKDLLEALFSNGVKGYILNGNIDVPYLAGEAEPTFVSAKFWNADGTPTAEVVEGNLVVTGIDNQTATYTITYVPMTPMDVDNQEITFTGVPSYIYCYYGWDAEKGVKFAKDQEEASNHRVSEGKNRLYIALPAGKEVLLTSGSAGGRGINVSVNGVVDGSVTQTAKSGEAITIQLNANQANFIAIEGTGNNGDGGFVSMKMNGWPTAIDNNDAEINAVKRIVNGQLFIEKNGVLYNAQGTMVK